jgi:hypothetical protein
MTVTETEEPGAGLELETETVNGVKISATAKEGATNSERASKAIHALIRLKIKIDLR